MREASDTYMITVAKMRPFNDTINGDEGKKWFISWLNNNNFTDITDTDTISQFCHYDIEATLNSVKYCFELKNRTFPSYRYGDVLLSQEKYDYLNNINTRTILVTFYTDKFVLIDIKKRKPDEITTQKCKKQTVFSDNRVIEKKVVKYYTKNLILLDYD